MTTAIVYSPTSGQVISNSIYCNKTGHPPHTIIIGGYGGPIDITSAALRSMRLYPTQVNSVRTQRVDYCCTNRAHPWTRGVLVKLYSDASGLESNRIGSILFAHLEYRIDNGLYNWNNTSLWGLWIGRTPTTDCSCGCYDGHHIHIEHSGADISRNFNCQSPVNAGQHWVYQFFY